ncbi:hypothetical protein [Rhizobium sp. FKY42]|uniref:hypothetical protein n=1 Tax=Rhizobium sp. FKY42 TaxID=2562310 RepID=UPI0010C12308|nr:hypothetical protein [Rhizobium sp. FKY42]
MICIVQRVCVDLLILPAVFEINPAPSHKLISMIFPFTWSHALPMEIGIGWGSVHRTQKARRGVRLVFAISRTVSCVRFRLMKRLRLAVRLSA